MKILNRISKNKREKLISFTFDDGPSDSYTTKILKILKQNHAKATFFVLGSNAEKRKSLLKKIIESKNEIGNHTYDHEYYSDVQEKDLIDSINRTQAIIQNSVNYSPTLFRFPGGKYTRKGLKIVKDLNLIVVNWTIDSGDWFLDDSDYILKNILTELHEGSIILFHDSKQVTIDVILKLFKYLNKSGYSVTTVSGLMKHYNANIKPGDIFKEALIDEKQ